MIFRSNLIPAMAATYTVKQVAEILGYSTNSIYTFLNEKRIEGVRVGKGRFRIPQSEIDRLLLSVKKSPGLGQVASPTTPTAESSLVQDGSAGQAIHLIAGLRLSLPNIFDWFIGTAAVVTGLALFLFNRTFEQSSSSNVFHQYLVSIRIILIAVGLGVLATSVFVEKKRFWHYLFHLILALSGSIMVYGLMRSGDWAGAITYGFLAVVVAATLVIHTDGVAMVTGYVILLALAIPGVILLAPLDPHVVGLLNLLQVSPAIGAIVVGSVNGILALLLIIGYFRYAPFFWIGAWGSALLFIGLSFFYAEDGYWSRSFFFIILGLVTVFLPAWRRLRNLTKPHDQLLIHGIFSSIFLLQIVAVLFVYLMQANLIEQVNLQLSQQARYGAGIVESSLDTATAALVTAAGNPVLVEAVKSKDLSVINETSKLIYESNSTIRRLVYLDRDGGGVALYPFGTFDLPNYSFRDYFIETKRTGKPYLSGVFTAQVDQSNRKVVAIAVPLADPDREFAGVIVGSIDWDRIGVKLQDLAFSHQEEYYVIVDGDGRRVVHPDTSLIGQALLPDDPLRAALAGREGVDWARTADGKQAIAAYGPINQLGWAIGVKAPVSSVVAIGDQITIMIFAIIALSTIAAAIFMSLLSARSNPSVKLKPAQGDSS